ncbi:rho GTPase-activating protein 11A isoform X2 [Melanerpes formicivorus]|uniref:rho GTPase-activating protein 11A isoform X2 n=1 Tax=Melanerpes formicivorus TaxID=211600 RepID=UPI00358F25D1
MAEQRGKLVRLAVLEELRASYGIKVKSGSCLAGAKQPAAAATEGKIFGVCFHALPQSLVPEYGYVPSFLVDTCEYLEEHVHTEGLFRKSGSLLRLKALKSKLDQGENCLSAALPCDVAGLLKQFFRELPEPILPPHLQEGLFKAQQLGDEKRAATVLLSCLMADRTIDALRYFFNFLRTVSLRSKENRMDSSNLAVIFAPNLLHCTESEKMSAGTERKLRLQAAVVQTLIEHAAEIGQVPDFILEKIPAMLGVDASQSTPSLWGHEDSENESPSDCKKRRHRSVGDFVSGALSKIKSSRTPSTTPQPDRRVLPSVTPVVLTPSTKRKLPTDCSQALSSKKRRSFKHTFAFELLPSSIFNISSTPASVQFEGSPCVSLESSQTSLSPSTGGETNLNGTGNRRSKRHASKKLYRAESGRTGCFSPKVSRKEMVRRSLRLKFGLGKSREMNAVPGGAGGSRSESIGRRLASQQGLESRSECATAEAFFSPCVSEKFPKKGSKNVSKSEENLLAPKCHSQAHRMSWCSPPVTAAQVVSRNEEGILPGHSKPGAGLSEPGLVFGKPTGVAGEFKASTASREENSLELWVHEDESNSAAETLLKVKEAFSASGGSLHNLTGAAKSSFSGGAGETLNARPCLRKLSSEEEELSAEKASESAASTKPREPLLQASQTSAGDTQQARRDEVKALEKRSFKTSLAIELQLPTAAVKGVTDLAGPQVLAREEKLTGEKRSSRDSLNKLHSLGRREGTELTHSQAAENCRVNCCPLEEEATRGPVVAQLPALPVPQSQSGAGDQHTQAEKAQPGTSALPDHGKVSDHIQWFNKLSLKDPSSASKTKPPLKFQRTPVRQSVRRINSLLEATRPQGSSRLLKAGEVGSPLVKSLSCDSALSSCTENPPKDSLPLPLGSSDQVSGSQQQLDFPPKLWCRPLNPPGGADAAVRAAGLSEQKVTLPPPKAVLEDLTNRDPVKSTCRAQANGPEAAPGKSTITRSASGKARGRYRGSPKNPIAQVKLLPAAKPVDL